MATYKTEIDLTKLMRNNKVILPYESIHEDLSFLFFCGQIFATFPIQGLWQKDLKKIKFKLYSLRTFMAITNLIFGIVISLFCFLEFFYYGIELSKMATFSFWLWNIIESYYFIKLAKDWQTIVREWYSVDMPIKSFLNSRKLKRKLITIAVIFGVLGVCEHLLFVTNNITRTIRCYNTSKIMAKNYYGIAYPHVFNVVDFDIWKAVFVQLSNFWMTGLWNFADIFIVLLCTAIAVRFQQLNHRLRLQYTNSVFWKTFRDDYTKLTKLCTKLDDKISPIILLSIINNLCFICIQLYNSIKPRQGFIEVTYFFYSFGYLTVRILTVALYVAWINDESRKSLAIIHSLPSKNFDYEVSRLAHQIYTHPVGFTGFKCFLITRSIILRIAGTIVTFELMLFQFGPYFQNRIQNSTSNKC